MHTRHVGLALGVLLVGWGGVAAAQPVGTFRWQLQPFCNVVTVAITQNGAVYRLEGTDDQCGSGGDAASVTGTAFPNADGTIGFGLNIVTAPGGRPVHVDAEISLGTFSGTWRDSGGASGTFVLAPGAGSGGTARPLPSSGFALPTPIDLRQDGGFVAGGALDAGAIPATGPGVRSMWYPGKAAFRAGRVTAAAWDDGNIGAASAAFGINTVASGSASTALGVRATASGVASTAMGSDTTATGNASTAMGNSTTARGSTSTAMGAGTTASGNASTSMGNGTTASGTTSTAMGFNSIAGGSLSLAAGSGVTANGDSSVVLGSNAETRTGARGTFLFGDGTFGERLVGQLSNQFMVRAAGGVVFHTNAALSAGVQIGPGGNQWLSFSDVNMKRDFRPVDGETLLGKLAQMPVQEWSYKAQDPAIRHIGPTAQDFHAAFGLGEDPLRIGTLDADGVALAGVRALEARSRHQADEVVALRLEVARLRELVTALTAAPR